MKKELKLLFVTTVIAVGGFLFNYFYFDPKFEERNFSKTLNNQLLTEVSNSHSSIELTNDSIISFFSKNYGLSGNQIDSIYSKYYVY